MTTHRARSADALERPWASLVDALQAQALERADERAFVLLDAQGGVKESHTFASLDARARTIAAALVARGLQGRRVLLLFPHDLNLVAALYACFYAGCVAVPAPFLTARQAGQRIATISDDAEPAAVLSVAALATAPEFAGTIDPAVPLICIDQLDAARADGLTTSADPDAAALIQYTSGSSGAPKGVVLTHANLLANCTMIRERFGHWDHGVGVSWLPMFHDMGLIGHLLHPVYVGALSVLMSPMHFLARPISWPRAISRWRGIVSGGPTFAFDLLLRSVRPEQMAELDLSSWELAYCGSERVNPAVLERFADTFGRCGFDRKALQPCYGLAEATLMVSGGPSGLRTSPPPARNADEPMPLTGRVASCGRAPQGSRIAIVDPDSLQPVGEGIVGEVWVKGPHIARGYWANATATAASFGARLGPADGGYLRTGDLGFMRDGELFVVGRLKDTIIVRGENHAPEDIETTVKASHQAFAALPGAAFAIIAGEEEQVVVVQAVNRADASPDEIQSAAERAFEHVTRDHGLRLHDFVLVRAGAIPRTSSGKVQRQQCRTLYLEGRLNRLNAADDLRWLGINRAGRDGGVMGP